MYVELVLVNYNKFTTSVASSLPSSVHTLQLFTNTFIERPHTRDFLHFILLFIILDAFEFTSNLPSLVPGIVFPFQQNVIPVLHSENVCACVYTVHICTVYTYCMINNVGQRSRQFYCATFGAPIEFKLDEEQSGDDLVVWSVLGLNRRRTPSARSSRTVFG